MQTVRLQTVRKSLVCLVTNSRNVYCTSVGHNSTRETAGSNPNRHGKTKSTNKKTAGWREREPGVGYLRVLSLSIVKTKPNKFWFVKNNALGWFEKVENKTEFFAKRVAKQSNGKETQSTTRPSSLHCIDRKINYMFEEKGDSRELSVGESSHRPFVFIHKSLGFFLFL